MKNQTGQARTERSVQLHTYLIKSINSVTGKVFLTCGKAHSTVSHLADSLVSLALCSIRSQHENKTHQTGLKSFIFFKKSLKEN